MTFDSPFPPPERLTADILYLLAWGLGTLLGHRDRSTGASPQYVHVATCTLRADTGPEGRIGVGAGVFTVGLDSGPLHLGFAASPCCLHPNLPCPSHLLTEGPIAV